MFVKYFSSPTQVIPRKVLLGCCILGPKFWSSRGSHSTEPQKRNCAPLPKKALHLKRTYKCFFEFCGMLSPCPPPWSLLVCYSRGVSTVRLLVSRCPLSSSPATLSPPFLFSQRIVLCLDLYQISKTVSRLYCGGGWGGCTSDFNGDMYLPIMLNSIVHVLVYLHYVLAALGRHSWWSPYLASLQLTQFVVSAGLFVWGGRLCGRGWGEGQG